MLLFFFFFYFFTCGMCKSDIPIGYRVTLPVPSSTHYYNSSNNNNGTTFIGRAFLMETSSYDALPSFKVGLSVEEAVNGKHSCSLGVFLGDVRVWNSGHFYSHQFYATDMCMLELTKYGDLQLKDSKGSIGWRSGTSAQGVQRLQLLRTGNLVLSDAMNLIKWQSFNFPTNVMLWGQRLSISTRLTSFPNHNNSTNFFYSFDIQNNTLVLYINAGEMRYSYWEHKLSKNKSIAFAQLGSTGLKLFDGNTRKVAQILPNPTRHEPLRFLALEDNTGNMKFYHYSPNKRKFEASFEAINTTCDLPLACGPFGICTFSNSCACIQLSNKVYHHHRDPNCQEDFSSKFCSSSSPVEMVEIAGVNSILKAPPQKVNVSKEECLNLCINDCNCAAVLYATTATATATIFKECFHYGFVRGVKQAEQGTGLSYLVKVPKRFGGGNGKKTNVKKWLLIVVGVVDGLVILLAVGGFGYYICVIRTRNGL